MRGIDGGVCSSLFVLDRMLALFFASVSSVDRAVSDYISFQRDIVPIVES